MKWFLLVIFICVHTPLWASEVPHTSDAKVQLAVIDERIRNTNGVLEEVKNTLKSTDITLQSLNLSLSALHYRMDSHERKIASLESLSFRHTEALYTLEVEKRRISGIIDFMGILLGAIMTAGAVFGFIKRDRIKAYIKEHTLQ